MSNNDTPSLTLVMEIIHQRKRVAKSDAADLGVKLQIDFDEVLDQKFSFADENLWKEVEKIAVDVAAEATENVANRFEKLGFPREFAPDAHFRGWHGRYVIEERKAELRRATHMVIAARLKTTAREIEKHALAAMQKIIQPGMTAHDLQAVIDEPLPLINLMQPVSYEDAEKMRGKGSRPRAMYSSQDGMHEMQARRSHAAEEPEVFDREALREEFRRLVD